MSEEQQYPWDRIEEEPPIWHKRFTAFRLMEPTRSIAAVFHEENSKKLEKTRKHLEPDGTWYAKAKEWQWEERAAAWDAYLDEQIEKQITSERKKVLRSRFALMHKRVELLDRKAQQLVEITDDEEKIWLPDVKSVGTGPGAQRVDLVQFNDAAFRELRGYLDDIAAELGERVKTTKQDITGQVEFSDAKDLLLLKIQQLREAKARQEQEGNDESH